MEDSEKKAARIEGQNDVLTELMSEYSALMDKAFKSRSLGQESVGKQHEETAKYILKLVSELPSRLRNK